LHEGRQSDELEQACIEFVFAREHLSRFNFPTRRWSTQGAQAILTMRGWDQSDRFDEAWALVAATYHHEIQVLANVVDITPPAVRKPRARTPR